MMLVFVSEPDPADTRHLGFGLMGYGTFENHLYIGLLLARSGIIPTSAFLLSFGAFRNHPYIGLLLPLGVHPVDVLMSTYNQERLGANWESNDTARNQWLHAPVRQGTFRSTSLHRPWAVLSAYRIVLSGCSLASPCKTRGLKSSSTREGFLL